MDNAFQMTKKSFARFPLKTNWLLKKLTQFIYHIRYIRVGDGEILKSPNGTSVESRISKVRVVIVVKFGTSIIGRRLRIAISRCVLASRSLMYFV